MNETRQRKIAYQKLLRREIRNFYAESDRIEDCEDVTTLHVVENYAENILSGLASDSWYNIRYISAKDIENRMLIEVGEVDSFRELMLKYDDICYFYRDDLWAYRQAFDAFAADLIAINDMILSDIDDDNCSITDDDIKKRKKMMIAMMTKIITNFQFNHHLITQIY